MSGRHGVVPSVLAENSPRVFEGAAGKLAMPVRVPTGARALREPRDAPYKQPSRTTLHKNLRVFHVSGVGDQRRLQNGRCACLQPLWMRLCNHEAAGCPDPSACVYLRKCTMVCGANAAVFVLCGSLVVSAEQAQDQMSAPAGSSPHKRGAFAAEGRGKEVAPVAFDASGALGAPAAGDGQSRALGGAFAVPRRRSTSPAAQTSSGDPGRAAVYAFAHATAT